MKFNTVKDLINYLEDFNPNAEVLTDVSFSWFKEQFKEPNPVEDKKSTSGLYVYGEYNPFYNKNKNFYRIKDFIIHNFFDDYNFVDLVIFFENEVGEPVVEYYLKYTSKWSVDKVKTVTKEILKSMKQFCEENGMMEEFGIIDLYLIHESEE